jgi:hypothetical protein
LNADKQINPGVLGTNMFAYCMNNPVNMADNEGDFPFFVVTAIVGAVVGAVVGGVVAAKTGNNVWAGIGIGAAAGGLIGLGAGAAAGALLGGGVTASTGAVMSGGAALVSSAGTAIGTAATAVGTKIANTVSTVGSKAAQVGSKVVSAVSNIKAPPANPGVPFQPGGHIGSIQYGVNPNTLIPQKILSTLDPQRIQDAVKFAGNKALEVSRSGIIQQGHHRAAGAIANGRTVDVVIMIFG